MFVVTCTDKPDSLALRMENRPAHLDYMKANIHKVVLAGPLLTEDRQTFVGSMLVLDFTDRAELDAFLAQDPYVTSGLFASVTIAPFRKVLP